MIDKKKIEALFGAMDATSDPETHAVFKARAFNEIKSQASPALRARLDKLTPAFRSMLGVKVRDFQEEMDTTDQALLGLPGDVAQAGVRALEWIPEGPVGDAVEWLRGVPERNKMLPVFGEEAASLSPMESAENFAANIPRGAAKLAHGMFFAPAEMGANIADPIRLLLKGAVNGLMPEDEDRAQEIANQPLKHLAQVAEYASVPLAGSLERYAAPVAGQALSRMAELAKAAVPAMALSPVLTDVGVKLGAGGVQPAVDVLRESPELIAFPPAMGLFNRVAKARAAASAQEGAAFNQRAWAALDRSPLLKRALDLVPEETRPVVKDAIKNQFQNVTNETTLFAFLKDLRQASGEKQTKASAPGETELVRDFPAEEPLVQPRLVVEPRQLPERPKPDFSSVDSAKESLRAIGAWESARLGLSTKRRKNGPPSQVMQFRQKLEAMLDKATSQDHFEYIAERAKSLAEEIQRVDPEVTKMEQSVEAKQKAPLPTPQVEPIKSQQATQEPGLAGDLSGPSRVEDLTPGMREEVDLRQGPVVDEGLSRAEEASDARDQERPYLDVNAADIEALDTRVSSNRRMARAQNVKQLRALRARAEQLSAKEQDYERARQQKIEQDEAAIQHPLIRVSAGLPLEAQAVPAQQHPPARRLLPSSRRALPASGASVEAPMPAAEPPIADGMVRLYRAEGADAGVLVNAPEWMKDNAGRYFTPDRRAAESYLKPGGKMVYLDAPPSAVEAWKTGEKAAGGEEVLIPEQARARVQLLDQASGARKLMEGKSRTQEPTPVPEAPAGQPDQASKLREMAAQAKALKAEMERVAAQLEVEKADLAAKKAELEKRKAEEEASKSRLVGPEGLAAKAKKQRLSLREQEDAATEELMAERAAEVEDIRSKKRLANEEGKKIGRPTVGIGESAKEVKSKLGNEILEKLNSKDPAENEAGARQLADLFEAQAALMDRPHLTALDSARLREYERASDFVSEQIAKLKEQQASRPDSKAFVELAKEAREKGYTPEVREKIGSKALGRDGTREVVTHEQGLKMLEEKRTPDHTDAANLSELLNSFLPKRMPKAERAKAETENAGIAAKWMENFLYVDEQLSSLAYVKTKNRLSGGLDLENLSRAVARAVGQTYKAGKRIFGKREAAKKESAELSAKAAKLREELAYFKKYQDAFASSPAKPADPNLASSQLSDEQIIGNLPPGRITPGKGTKDIASSVQAKYNVEMNAGEGIKREAFLDKLLSGDDWHLNLPMLEGSLLGPAGKWFKDLGAKAKDTFLGVGTGFEEGTNIAPRSIQHMFLANKVAHSIERSILGDIQLSRADGDRISRVVEKKASQADLDWFKSNPESRLVAARWVRFTKEIQAASRDPNSGLVGYLEREGYVPHVSDLSSRTSIEALSKAIEKLQGRDDLGLPEESRTNFIQYGRTGKVEHLASFPEAVKAYAKAVAKELVWDPHIKKVNKIVKMMTPERQRLVRTYMQQVLLRKLDPNSFEAQKLGSPLVASTAAKINSFLAKLGFPVDTGKPLTSIMRAASGVTSALVVDPVKAALSHGLWDNVRTMSDANTLADFAKAPFKYGRNVLKRLGMELGLSQEEMQLAKDYMIINEVWSMNDVTGATGEAARGFAKWAIKSPGLLPTIADDASKLGQFSDNIKRLVSEGVPREEAVEIAALITHTRNNYGGMAYMPPGFTGTLEGATLFQKPRMRALLGDMKRWIQGGPGRKWAQGLSVAAGLYYFDKKMGTDVIQRIHLMPSLAYSQVMALAELFGDIVFGEKMKDGSRSSALDRAKVVGKKSWVGRKYGEYEAGELDVPTFFGARDKTPTEIESKDASMNRNRQGRIGRGLGIKPTRMFQKDRQRRY